MPTAIVLPSGEHLCTLTGEVEIGFLAALQRLDMTLKDLFTPGPTESELCRSILAYATLFRILEIITPEQEQHIYRVAHELTPDTWARLLADSLVEIP